ncbi:DUF3934 family protein [Paenibacillus sp. IHBB 10380]|uniref:DUF3934 family protein n=1 Tax=Paenibacillus sp. IHBB 10380 TaxID=1566358 RepID=UPI0005CFC432|nr:DUF3934 family protein [Paenibacillus sp. IHBB 10380]AJS57261.1 hypothetical protein UB51_00710 [Paenibacillus sp. IHBB 10380]
MSKAKGKGGTGRGTGSKGWTRWNKTDKGKKAIKPYPVKYVKGSEKDKSDGDSKDETALKKEIIIKSTKRH